MNCLNHEPEAVFDEEVVDIWREGVSPCSTHIRYDMH